MISSQKIVLLAMLTFMSENILSQEDHGRKYPPYPDKESIVDIVNLLDKDLDLCDIQKREIHRLYQKHFSDVKDSIEIREKTNSYDESFRIQMHEMKNKFEAEVRALLDIDQKRKFDSYLFNLRMHREHFHNVNRKPK